MSELASVAPAGAVNKYLADRFGGTCRHRARDHTVGLSVSNLLGNDFERFAVVFVNLSANDIYIANDPTVSSTHGIRVGSGSAVSVAVEEDGVLPALEWWAIGAAAALSVFTLEVRRETGPASVTGGV